MLFPSFLLGDVCEFNVYLDVLFEKQTNKTESVTIPPTVDAIPDARPVSGKREKIEHRLPYYEVRKQNKLWLDWKNGLRGNGI